MCVCVFVRVCERAIGIHVVYFAVFSGPVDIVESQSTKQRDAVFSSVYERSWKFESKFAVSCAMVRGEVFWSRHYTFHKEEREI
jgi:hypothetical protein